MSADGRGAKWIAIGAAMMALTVVLGAFGAHALKERVLGEALEWWRTAVLYQAMHSLGVIAYGSFIRASSARDGARSDWPALAFAAGAVLFCGSLYALALGAGTWIGMVTPIGGGLWIAGWVGFALQAWRSRGGA